MRFFRGAHHSLSTGTKTPKPILAVLGSLVFRSIRERSHPRILYS